MKCSYLGIIMTATAMGASTWFLTSCATSSGTPTAGNEGLQVDGKKSAPSDGKDGGADPSSASPENISGLNTGSTAGDGESGAAESGSAANAGSNSAGDMAASPAEGNSVNNPQTTANEQPPVSNLANLAAEEGANSLALNNPVQSVQGANQLQALEQASNTNKPNNSTVVADPALNIPPEPVAPTPAPTAVAELPPPPEPAISLPPPPPPPENPEGPAIKSSVPPPQVTKPKRPKELTPEEAASWRAIAAKLRNLSPGEGPSEWIVQPGDTLWDISDQLIDDAFWWPKLWTFNPQISNPHLIYPGNKIVFVPSGGGGDGDGGGGVAAGPQLAVQDAGEVLPVAALSSIVTKFPGEADKSWEEKLSELIDPKELGTDSSFDFPGQNLVVSSFPILVPGYLSRSSPTPLGVVERLGEQGLVSAKGGVAYARFAKPPTPGERFLAVREVERGVDPTGELESGPDAYLYSGVVGVAKVHASGLVTLVVEDSLDGVSVDDVLVPFKSIYQIIDPVAVAPKANIKAQVMAIPGDRLAIARVGQTVLLTRATEGNVSIGEELDLFMPEGGIVGFKEDELDGRAVARARVIEVTEESIAAIIIHATREVSVGARTWGSF